MCDGRQRVYGRVYHLAYLPEGEYSLVNAFHADVKCIRGKHGQTIVNICLLFLLLLVFNLFLDCICIVDIRFK